MNFKDFIANDIKTFINIEEFGELHSINGISLTVLKDDDKLEERSKKEYDGISVGEILYFVKADDYGDPPKEDEIQIFDNKSMQVFSVRVDNGIYEIILKSWVR